MPGLVEGRLVLASEPRMAAWVESLRAWPEGLEFDLVVVTAAGAVARNEYGGLDIAFDLRQPEDHEIAFELGVTASGRETSNTSTATWPGRELASDELLVLPQQGGGGGGEEGGYWRLTWWLTPLPTAGPVEFWCRWKRGEILRSGATIDGGVLANAAAQAAPARTRPRAIAERVCWVMRSSCRRWGWVAGRCRFR